MSILSCYSHNARFAHCSCPILQSLEDCSWSSGRNHEDLHRRRSQVADAKYSRGKSESRELLWCKEVSLTIEHQDIDVIIEGKAGGPLINRKKLRNEIVSLDGRFAVNLGGVCRVTYRDPVTKVITAINILSPEVVGTWFIMLAMDHSHARIYRLGLRLRVPSFLFLENPSWMMTSLWCLLKRLSR